MKTANTDRVRVETSEGYVYVNLYSLVNSIATEAAEKAALKICKDKSKLVTAHAVENSYGSGDVRYQVTVTKRLKGCNASEILGNYWITVYDVDKLKQIQSVDN